MTEGEPHSAKHESIQPHSIKDRTWLVWEWSTKLQQSARSRLVSHVVSPWFVATIHERFKQWH